MIRKIVGFGDITWVALKEFVLSVLNGLAPGVPEAFAWHTVET